MQKNCRGVDFNLLRHRANSQRRVDAGLLVHIQNDVCELARLKSLRADSDCVVGGRQLQYNIVACVVGCGGVSDSRAVVPHSDCCAGNDCAGRIVHGSAQGRSDALRPTHGDCGDDEREKKGKYTSIHDGPDPFQLALLQN